MPRGSARRRSKKKEALLLAAEQLFLQRGIRPVTVEEIVSRAQVSKATFYKYFSDKKDILEPVVQKIVDAELAHLTSLVEKGKRDRLTLEDFLTIFDTREYEHLFQSAFAIELMQDYPDIVHKWIDPARSQGTRLFHDFIRMAKIDGIIRMDVDADVLFIYTQLLRKAFAQHPQTPERMSLQEFTQKMYDLYLYGVVTRKGKG